MIKNNHVVQPNMLLKMFFKSFNVGISKWLTKLTKNNIRHGGKPSAIDQYYSTMYKDGKFRFYVLATSSVVSDGYQLMTTANQSINQLWQCPLRATL